jgi:outer membrane protein assembly factor BamB
MPDQQETHLGQQVGEYRLMRKLGGGNFGTVYLAEHIHEHTQVAAKVLHIPLTRSEDFKDFINEARTIRLRHPHIVPLLDFGISRGDLPFLVMEYAPEGTLRDRHPKGARLPLPTIVSYVNQIASALQYAHDQRIIHRDVKPENILLRANGTLLMSDFGLAKLLEQSLLTSHQKLAGTPMYMAPEQHRGYPCFASDQYSLAVIIYEWLCGTRPFQGTAFGLVAQHMHTPPPSLRDRLPALPEAVEHVIFKALAKTPEGRFGRIQEFADALRIAARPALALNPAIETINTAPLTTPETAFQPPTGPKPTAPAPTTASTRPEPATHMTSGAVPHHSSTQTPHSLSQTPPISSPSQKRRLSKSFPLLIGGTLGLVLLLVILAIVIWPLILGATPTQADQIVHKWTFPTGSYVFSSPKVVNGTLYIGSYDSSVYAIDIHTSRKIWSFPTGAYVDSSPAIVNNVLYIGSGDKNVYAIDTHTGQKIWAFSTGAYVDSSPTIVNDVLYIGSGDKNVYAIDTHTGQKIWAFLTGDPVSSSPTVVNGVLYIGSGDKNVYAIDTNTGQKIWAFSTGGPVSSSPTVVDGVLYIGSQDNKVYAIDAGTGLLKWAFSTDAPIKYSSPTVVNGVLYIGSQDNKVYAINTSTGLLKWAFPTGDAVQSSPTVVNGILYIGSDNHNVYAVDTNTGQQKWVFPTGSQIFSSPTIVDGVLYIGSEDYNVYALTLPTSSS